MILNVLDTVIEIEMMQFNFKELGIEIEARWFVASSDMMRLCHDW